MASQINPALINGQFPVQGVDNPSQGLRTNFTNTQLNFAYAAAEITDLQNKCLLKSPLNGGTANNSMGGSILNGGSLQNFSEVAVQLGTQGGSVNINYAAGHWQTLTTSGVIDINITNWPTSGSKGWITIQFAVTHKSHRIGFPTGIGINEMGITGYDQATNCFWAPVPGYYSFTFISYDGGFTVTVDDPNSILVPNNSSWEDLGPNSEASLGVVNSVITTTTGLTNNTLQAGVEGQTKTFAMYLAGGVDVVTVYNSGWNNGGIGTITLNTTGDTITLKVIKGRWFVIANWGAIVA